MNRNRLANLIGIGIGAAGIGFVVSRIVRDREAIGDALSSADIGWLLVGGALGLLAMAMIGANWLLILRHNGAAAPWRRGMAWFYVGQLGKYVPGGIWPIVGQAELARRDATPRGAAYSSTAMSMVTTFLAAATVAVITGTIAPTDARWWVAALAALLGLFAAAFASPRVRNSVERLIVRVTKRELRLAEPRWFALVVARHLPVWVAFAGMNIFAVVALGVDLDASLVVELIFATSVSWMAGFVIVGVPGGIGVRETVFISLTTATLGADIAVSAAVLSRVVSIAVDLAGAACSSAVAKTAPTPTPTDDRADPVVLDRYAAP